MGDLLSSISVLLVFLTFLFNDFEKDVSEKIIQRKPPKAQVQELKEFNNALRELLRFKMLPVTIIFIATFYSLLPKAIYIIRSSSLSLWRFDELKTIFVFIEFGLLCLTFYAISKIVQLRKKINEKS